MFHFVFAAIEATVSMLGAPHFRRKDGSRVVDHEGWDDGEIVSWLGMQDWSEITDDLPAEVKGPGCRYFRAEIPDDLEAFTAAVNVNDLTDIELQWVSVRRGRKGNIEMVSDSIAPMPTQVMHLITGPHEGETVVYTWYPGPVTAARETVKLDG